MRRSGFRPRSISQSANWGIASENKLAAKDTISASVVDRAVLVWRFDSQDKGTNLFAFRSDLKPRFNFGPSSLKVHREWAQLSGLRASCLKSPGIGLDIDTLKDLRELFAAGNTGHIGKFTARLITQIHVSEC